MSARLSPDAVEWLVHGEHGLSSEAIFHFLFLGEGADRYGWSNEYNHPHDPDDFQRCEKLLRAVPELRPRMKFMASLGPVWRELVIHWDEIVATLEAECPGLFDGARRGRAPKTYELMRQIIEQGRAA